MGTFGCINDMQRQHKENRSQLKRHRERMHETRKRLIQTGRDSEIPDTTVEQMEKRKKEAIEKEQADARRQIKMQLLFVLYALLLFIIVGLVYTLCSDTIQKARPPHTGSGRASF